MTRTYPLQCARQSRRGNKAQTTWTTNHHHACRNCRAKGRDWNSTAQLHANKCHPYPPWKQQGQQTAVPARYSISWAWSQVSTRMSKKDSTLLTSTLKSSQSFPASTYSRIYMAAAKHTAEYAAGGYPYICRTTWTTVRYFRSYVIRILRGDQQARIVGLITLESKVCHPRWLCAIAMPEVNCSYLYCSDIQARCIQLLIDPKWAR